MNKKILNALIPTTQNSREQKQKTKTLIANLGAATQLTLGFYGNQSEKGPRPWGNLQQ